MGKFTNAFLHTCEGQGYDLLLTRGDRATVEAHRKMVEKKTALLMEAAASIGAMIGTSNEEHILALGRFGFDLGMAFQAKDDLLDAVGDEKTIGKPVRADRRNGKATFLTVGTAVAVDQVGEYIASACRALECLPPIPARDHLKSLAEFLLSRDK
jgi:geranylgeranyl pyrophosphate synthase